MKRSCGPTTSTIAALVVVAVFLATACTAGQGVASGTPGSTTRASTTPAPSVAASTDMPSASAPSASSAALPDPVDIEAAGALAIDATHSVDWVVIVDGQPWIAGLGDGMGILDGSGRLQESIAVTGWCESMDTGFGAVWSASCTPAGIIRIDAKTHAVDRVAFDQPIVYSEASVGVGEGAVWLVAGAQSDVLLEIDPESLKVHRRHSIPEGSAGVRVGLGGIWVTMPSAGELLRVDPASGEIVAKIPVGAGPRFLVVGEGRVWVMNQVDGTVSAVDPSTNTVTAAIDVGPEIHGGDIAVGGGSVWVRGGPELLARIDPAQERVIERYDPNSGSGSVAADDDAVWVTAHDVARIWRLPLD